MKRNILLIALLIPSKTQIRYLSKMQKPLKRWSWHCCPILKNCGKDTQKPSKSQNTPRHGGMITANFLLIDTNTLKASKIGIASKTRSRIRNSLSSMTKSKKLQTKNVAHRNL